MLERVSLRANAVVVNCLPSWEAVERSFKERAKEEYLDDTVQLRQVYDWYQYKLSKSTSLVGLTYDYEKDRMDDLVHNLDVILSNTPTHGVDEPTAGFCVASYLIVGEKYADHKENDPLGQYPFVSYSDLGCSRWLTQRLMNLGISENQLLWANMDADLDWLIKRSKPFYSLESAVILGKEAAKASTKILERHGIHRITMIDHPSYWRRFHAAETEGYEGILNLALKGG